MTHHESKSGHARHASHANHASHGACRCLSTGNLEVLFCSFASPILQTENFRKSQEYRQHGTISVYDHSVAVAYYSLKAANRLQIRCNHRRLVRGALLHDYFLYDWHLPHEPSGLHGYTHPGTALANAAKDFDLDIVERDMIARHMFPLTLIPPRFIESLIVCLVDKVCSFSEVFGLSSYPSLVFIDKESALC